MVTSTSGIRRSSCCSKRSLRWTVVFVVFATAGCPDPQFKVGYAEVDITPAKPMPMWGYSARRDALSSGVRDPLHAKAVVIDVGPNKLAIVGLDLGRSPMTDVMDRIRNAVRDQSGVDYILMSGSHTHHGPVLELSDEPGRGRGVFDDGVAYLEALEEKLIGVINDAAENVVEARIGWGMNEVFMNRNRHTRIEPKPVDSELNVLRFDDLGGRPIALVVNYAAHPTMLPVDDLRYSAEYPGQMMQAVEDTMGTNCIFMQGAAGDMSVRTTPETNTIETYGAALAEEVVRLASEIETVVPVNPSIRGADESFPVMSRIDLGNELVRLLFGAIFFPEMANRASDEIVNGIISPNLTTIVVNRDLALVGASGEFFCTHAKRLRRLSPMKTIFFGYCNGHHLYFPTIEASIEGGQGARIFESWVPVGTGERMIFEALLNIFFWNAIA